MKILIIGVKTYKELIGKIERMPVNLCKESAAMMLDREYFDNWMQRLAKRLEHIEELCTPAAEQSLSVLPDGDRLLDNYDLCKMLNISKRTLQRYRTSGDLPYQMIYYKTFYRESDVLRFIERNFSNFRKLKKERENNSFGKR